VYVGLGLFPNSLSTNITVSVEFIGFSNFDLNESHTPVSGGLLTSQQPLAICWSRLLLYLNLKPNWAIAKAKIDLGKTFYLDT